MKPSHFLVHSILICWVFSFFWNTSNNLCSLGKIRKFSEAERKVWKHWYCCPKTITILYSGFYPFNPLVPIFKLLYTFLDCRNVFIQSILFYNLSPTPKYTINIFIYHFYRLYNFLPHRKCHDFFFQSSSFEYLGCLCCDSWGRRVGHDWATELNWTELLF